MSDVSFEARLERLFAQPPHVSSPDRFVARVEARLDREWSLRRGLIGIAGVVGGIVAVSQTLGADLFAQAAGAAAPLTKELSRGWDASWYAQAAEGGLGGDAIWAVAALAALVTTLAVTRAAEAL